MEAHLLKLLDTKNASKYFCKVYDIGETGCKGSTFNYIVMTLCGQSLHVFLL